MPAIRNGTFAAAIALLIILGGAVRAAPTQYPLTIQNCGRAVTFDKAPGRVVTLGQSEVEILLAMGLADRVVGTAVWFGSVKPEFAAANARIKRLADNTPSFEAVVGQEPDLVVTQFEGYISPRGSVGTRDQFAGLGIATYVAVADCVEKDNSGGGDGVRAQMFSMELIYQEIRDYGAIFDVADRAEAFVAQLKAREAAARAVVAGSGQPGLPVVFWFSSRDVKGDAFVAGKNGAPAYILSTLGHRNVIQTNDEWPTVSWEAIVQANPAVIVVARMDRRRFPADDLTVKMRFLQTDPVVSHLRAVQQNHIVVIDAQSMNPTLRTIDGIEDLANGIKGFGLQP